MPEATYRSEDGYVWKNPVERPAPEGGRLITIGFRVCKMDEMVGDEAAETVAELMNRGELLPDAIAALRALDAVIDFDPDNADDFAKQIGISGQHTVRDLFETVRAVLTAQPAADLVSGA